MKIHSQIHQSTSSPLLSPQGFVSNPALLKIQTTNNMKQFFLLLRFKLFSIKENVPLAVGENKLQFPLTSIANGIYLLRFKINEASITLKIVVAQ